MNRGTDRCTSGHRQVNCVNAVAQADGLNLSDVRRVAEHRLQLTSKSEAVVKKLLPFDGEEFQYHIQTVPEGTERRELESKLRQT